MLMIETTTARRTPARTLASCRLCAAVTKNSVAGCCSGDGPVAASTRHREHVVQHERQALGRGQRLQHHEQREADRVGQQGLGLGVRLVAVRHDRVGQAHVEGVLAAGGAGTQHVQAHAAHHGGQPAAEVLDGTLVAAGQA
jgi:hypothetical protein